MVHETPIAARTTASCAWGAGLRAGLFHVVDNRGLFPVGRASWFCLVVGIGYLAADWDIRSFGDLMRKIGIVGPRLVMD